MWYRYVTSSWVRQKTGINSAGVPKPNLRSHADQEPDHKFLIFSFSWKSFQEKKPKNSGLDTWSLWILPKSEKMLLTRISIPYHALVCLIL